MANAQAICVSFKKEILQGIHAIETDTIKAALYNATASITGSTSAYTVTGEQSATGTYSAGGTTVTHATSASTTASTAFWTPSSSLQWTGVTMVNVEAVLLYNSSKANRAISVHTFGTQSLTNGTLTLTMPVNDATTGLLRLT